MDNILEPAKEDNVTKLPVGSLSDTLVKVGAQGLMTLTFTILLFLVRSDVIELVSGLRTDLREERNQGRKILENLALQQERNNFELNRISGLLQQQLHQQTKVSP